MLGTVKPFKPELKISEYEIYRAVYCTLCRRLGKSYGHLFRITLSYDSAFLALVGLSLRDQPCTCKKSHCVYNPFKSCAYLENGQDIIDRVAAISVLMVYFQVKDHVRDSRGIKRLSYRLALRLLRRRAGKAASSEAQAFAILSELDEQQASVERQDVGPEEAAEPTAVALGRLCRLFSMESIDGKYLYRMGYCLGKWVYLADALADRESDVKKGTFNPLLDSDEDPIRQLMNLCSNEAGEAFDRLPTLCYENIIRNILYLGLPHELDRILSRKEEKS